MELTMSTVRTEGFGMVTNPWKLSPCESGCSETVEEVILIPVNAFNPIP